MDNSFPAWRGPAAPGQDRRLAGALATVLVHGVLVLLWQMTRVPPPQQQEETSIAVQWIHTQVSAPRAQAAGSVQVDVARGRPRAGDVRMRSWPAREHSSHPGPAAVSSATPAADPGVASSSQPSASDPAPAAPAPASPVTGSIMDNARRSIGSIDRELRKQNRPLIVAPPDSPQIRLRKGMEHAHAMAPPRLWEAPKVEELVNNTGDGARRTRVITGNGTYCITERAPTTSIDMIEKHGKIRLTNCPEHEEPAKRQEWRTARD
ncbi:hypothetical protein [Massilia sp. ST3]|uniref:hypothetical protein n=1 Tax=Massilia sp. ST3 TaxID=2824903 RepID=UPI001B84629D|nr:hypothetical protein [Massilia sp. ST3]MBQ5947470.1 hypothetical protein [Massilia sp. ST3]